MTEYGAHVLNTFDYAAKHWGWWQDQGYGERVDVAEKDYNDIKEELAAYIQSLEDEIEQLKINKSGIVSYQPNLMQYKSISYYTPE